jgi:4a-hydroxytetrahydrobiopterin dehydratase
MVVCWRANLNVNFALRLELVEPLSSNMAGLSSKECVPCRGGVPPLKGQGLVALQAQVEGWAVIDEHHLERQFAFPNFRDALAFVNRVGEVAEAQNHHPDFSLGWGKVGVKIWTHKIDGLTESDFILAAKINGLPR